MYNTLEEKYASQEQFEKKYSGDPKYNYDNQEGQEGMMETFSPHIDRVLKLANSKNPKDFRRVWTVIDGDETDDMYIVAGYHWVNRCYHFITNEYWESEDEEYIWHVSEGED